MASGHGPVHRPPSPTGAPQRGRLSLETCCQMSWQGMAGVPSNCLGNLPVGSHSGSGDPGMTTGSRWPPAADWEVARFSTSESEKAVLGIILGTGSHEKLQQLSGEAITSKTMNFDMDQAGETPHSLPRLRNPEFFPDEVSLPTSWRRGKPLQLPSHRLVPSPLPAAA